jgi:hypothetical protein
MDAPSLLSGDLGELHFGACRLGDARRTARLVDLANRIARRPDGTLPHQLHDPAAYRACCRLMNQAEVTHDAVLGPHCRATREALRQRSRPVLILHDTTTLDYSGHQVTTLGPVGNGGGKGYECHNSLAVDPDTGALLGLVCHILHTRARPPKGEGVAARRGRADRESRLWVRAVQAIGPAPAEGPLWVDVCDRGADTFEFLEYEMTHGRSFVVRSTHNRALVDTGVEQPRLLHDLLRSQAGMATWTVAVANNYQQLARTATVQASWVLVAMKAPHVRKGEHGRQPLTVWAIRVWEVDAPPEIVEPLEWFLLTNVAVADVVTARERVQWYERRPRVEEYHKSQKTGLHVEELRFTTRGALEPMIALVSVLAVGLVNLREAARNPQRSAEDASAYVDPLWVRVLSQWRYGEERALTVAEFTLALARLGGHLNRQCDGPPGWLTIWRGLNMLHAMIEYELSRARCGKE